jgi:membrane protein DedA with SNARE-associated domain
MAGDGDTADGSRRRPILRLVIALGGVLAVPLLPLIVLGLAFEAQLEQMLARPISDALAAGFVLGLLTLDVVLPVPSSALATFAGVRFGAAAAFGLVFLGLSAGSGFGYWLGRALRRPLHAGLSDPDRALLDGIVCRFGPWTIAACRPLPVLAEASTLAAGAGRLRSGAFWGPVSIANAVLAGLYAFAGNWAERAGWSAAVIIFAAVFPLALLIAARRIVFSFGPVDEQIDVRR